MTETVRDWANRAEYDLETARVMLASGRHFYVMFCCQQAVEKALKAVIISRTGKLAPRIHNLPRLAEIADLPINESTLELMARLSAFYFQSRYPGQMELPSGAAGKLYAEDTLTKTEETLKWLLSTLK